MAGSVRPFSGGAWPLMAWAERAGCDIRHGGCDGTSVSSAIPKSGHIAVEEPSCGSGVGGLMSRARSLFVFLLLLMCLLPGCATTPAQTVSGPPHVAYLDPALQGTSGPLSVIVTGRDSRSAARVVESAGGEVTSDLWIINAV